MHLNIKTLTKQLSCFVIVAVFVNAALQIHLANVVAPQRSRELFPAGGKKVESRRTTNSLPLFILHVGPRKTGSTTIQLFALQNRELLQRDGVYFLGRGKFEDVKGNARELNDFVALLEHHRQLNHTVFLSDENLSRLDHTHGIHKPVWPADYLVWSTLWPVLKKWRMRVLFTYRRHHEFYSGLYRQEYDPFTTSARRHLYTEWPDQQGGIEIPPMRDFFDKAHKNRGNDLLRVFSLFKENFDNLQVFNYHDTDNYLRDFVCSMIPEAQGACKVLTQEPQKKHKRENVAAFKHNEYDMIAVAAYRRGLVLSKMNRTFVAQAVQDFCISNNITTFPLISLLPHQASLLLNHSLKFEKVIVPKFYESSNGKEALKRGFAEYVMHGKLASVNASALLEQSRWTRFFQHLQNESQTS